MHIYTRQVEEQNEELERAPIIIRDELAYS